MHCSNLKEDFLKFYLSELSKRTIQIYLNDNQCSYYVVLICYCINLNNTIKIKFNAKANVHLPNFLHFAVKNGQICTFNGMHYEWLPNQLGQVKILKTVNFYVILSILIIILPSGFSIGWVRQVRNFRIFPVQAPWYQLISM